MNKPIFYHLGIVASMSTQLYHNKFELIAIKRIDPSPFQKRKYFDKAKLKELASSIEKDGLIEPVIIRPKGKRFELIAGERRFRAVQHYTHFDKILAKVIDVDDLKARRISAAENIQREDLSALETIEAIIDIVDVELFDNKEYATMGKTPEVRVNNLLGKLHSTQVSQSRGSKVSENGTFLFNKFVKQVEKIFNTLPKRLEWKSFYLHDLPLITDICDEIRKISVENQLNKAQTKAIFDVKKNSEDAFQHIVNKRKLQDSPQIESNENGTKTAKKSVAIWNECQRVKTRSG